MKKLLSTLLLCGSLTLNGCGDSQEELGFTTYGNVASPIARADVYSTRENTPVTITATTGVLSNDTLNATPQQITVSFPATTNSGGALTAADNEGAFTYTPTAGFSGTDSFSYTLFNGVASSSATVTITVTAADVIPPGYYVDSAHGSDATGDFTTGSPYSSIQAAVTAAGPNSDIVVVPGRGIYEESVTLLNGQRLLGAGSDLVTLQGASRPTLRGPIVLADGNTLDFLRVALPDGIAIDGDGQNSGTVTNCEIAGTRNGGTGLQIRAVSGTWLIAHNVITDTSGIGCDMDTQQSGTAIIRVNDNEISGSGLFGIGIAAIGQSQISVQVSGNILNRNQVGFGLFAIASGTSTLCLQLQDNQNGNDYRLNRQSDSATFNVEQLSQIETLNTGRVVIPQGSIADVPAGFCGF